MLASRATRWPSAVRPGPLPRPMRCRRRCSAARVAAAPSSWMPTSTWPVPPSTATSVPSGTSSALAQRTTAGRPSARARMAVWLVGPPDSVTRASTPAGSRPAVSAGARSRATSTNGWPGDGMPGIGRPRHTATARSRMSSRSAIRSARYPPASWKACRCTASAAAMAWAAPAPPRTASVTASASSGSWTMSTCACRTSAAVALRGWAAAARAARSAATAASASSARASSTSGSATGPGAGSCGGAATRYAGPAARPGLTPMPRRVSAIGGTRGRDLGPVRVEVAGEQVGQGVEGVVGPVALGFQDDLGAALGTERQHRQHAARRYRPLVADPDGDRDGQGRRPGVQAAGGADGDGSGGQGWLLRRNSGFDGDLDALATGDDGEAVERAVDREAVGDQVGDRYRAGRDQVQRGAVVRGTGPVGADDGELAVVHEIRVERDGRPVLRQPAEEADATLPCGHLDRLLLGGTGG